MWWMDSTKKWILSKSNQILLNTTINYYKNCKIPLINKIYINRIIFNQYSKSYDINQNNFFNILCNNVILHNSIEQDADIILILYEKDNVEKSININNSKIIDLKISKNRNGRTGYCELEFIPQFSKFKNKE